MRAPGGTRRLGRLSTTTSRGIVCPSTPPCPATRLLAASGLRGADQPCCPPPPPTSPAPGQSVGPTRVHLTFRRGGPASAAQQEPPWLRVLSGYRNAHAPSCRGLRGPTTGLPTDKAAAGHPPALPAELTAPCPPTRPLPSHLVPDGLGVWPSRPCPRPSKSLFTCSQRALVDQPPGSSRGSLAGLPCPPAPCAPCWGHWPAWLQPSCPQWLSSWGLAADLCRDPKPGAESFWGRVGGRWPLPSAYKPRKAAAPGRGRVARTLTACPRPLGACGLTALCSSCRKRGMGFLRRTAFRKERRQDKPVP